MSTFPFRLLGHLFIFTFEACDEVLYFCVIEEKL